MNTTQRIQGRRNGRIVRSFQAIEDLAGVLSRTEGQYLQIRSVLSDAILAGGEHAENAVITLSEAVRTTV